MWSCLALLEYESLCPLICIAEFLHRKRLFDQTLKNKVIIYFRVGFVQNFNHSLLSPGYLIQRKKIFRSNRNIKDNAANV